MTARSPSAAAPLHRAHAAKPSRSRSSSAVDRVVGDLDLGPPDLEAPVVAELGRRAHADLDRELELARPPRGGRETSSFGSPTGVIPVSSSARSYHSGSESRSACSSTASRPTRWITSSAGTLPRRKPGICISRPSCRAARSSRFATASGSTPTSMRTRLSGSSVTEVRTTRNVSGSVRPSVLALRLAGGRAPEGRRELGEEAGEPAERAGDEPGAEAIARRSPSSARP